MRGVWHNVPDVDQAPLPEAQRDGLALASGTTRARSPPPPRRNAELNRECLPTGLEPALTLRAPDRTRTGGFLLDREALWTI